MIDWHTVYTNWHNWHTVYTIGGYICAIVLLITCLVYIIVIARFDYAKNKNAAASVSYALFEIAVSVSWAMMAYFVWPLIIIGLVLVGIIYFAVTVDNSKTKRKLFSEPKKETLFDLDITK